MNEGQPFDQIHTLPIEPPPMLEEALGYGGPARHVAFYWGAGDEAYYDDGHISTQGEWDAYLLFIRHPLVEPLLQAALHQTDHLGSCEEEATHWLLLDREDRQIAVAPARIAKLQVSRQWGPPTSEHITVVDTQAWEHLVAEVTARIERISHDQIVAHMLKHQRVVQDLSAWLEMKWAELRLNERQIAHGPTFSDVVEVATQLEFDVSGGGEQDGTFDLDKHGDRSLGGTWSKNQAGLNDAYGYLIRYRQMLEQSDQVRGQQS